MVGQEDQPGRAVEFPQGLEVSGLVVDLVGPREPTGEHVPARHGEPAGLDGHLLEIGLRLFAELGNGCAGLLGQLRESALEVRSIEDVFHSGDASPDTGSFASGQG